MIQTNPTNVSVVNLFSPVFVAVNYVRTKEDEEQDKAEREWKKERNSRACREFLYNYPSGRPPQ